jgi:hypothetical protein
VGSAGRGLDENYSHEEIDRIEKEVAASATYEGQSVVYHAEPAMSSIWISSDDRRLPGYTSVCSKAALL